MQIKKRIELGCAFKEILRIPSNHDAQTDMVSLHQFYIFTFLFNVIFQ